MTDDPHALRPGASIAGYNILRVLGAGGFGITYEAESPFTGKRVAIKEFFPRGIASRSNEKIVYAERDAEIVAWALKRFRSSTLDQCGLSHPNIVDVVHYVKDNDTGYMIMEYVEGETLDRWLLNREFLPAAEELQPVLAPVFSALEYLHARNMIHRDIAPDNIMIRADGRPVIIDFGAIKLIGQETQLRSQTRSFAVMKQFYSPPEQIEEGGELDHRADIYSIGAVLYRAFSGFPPASAEDRMQKRAFGKQDPYVPLAEAASHVPEQIAAAVDRALSFNGDARPSQIAALREELGWRGDPQLPTFIVPREEDAEMPPRRSVLPWLIPLAGIAALAIAAAIMSGFFSLPAFLPAEKPAPEIAAPQMDAPKQIQEAPVYAPSQQDANKPDATQETAENYMVVVASHRTEPEAEAALAKLKTEFPALFADHHTEIAGVDLGESGTFYRAMIGPLDKADADRLCREFKEKNVACLVRMDN